VNDPKSEYLKPPAIAKLLGVQAGKVLAWIAASELVAVDLSERRAKRPRWRVSPADLEAFLERRKSQPTPKPRSRRRSPVVIAKKYF
jgi:hypothetical protein